MKFNILDTEASYRRLLAAGSPEARERIFQEELIEPFEGLIMIFGGDGPQVFQQWGMWPEQFNNENREAMVQIVEKLSASDAWTKAAEALEEGKRAFEGYYLERIPIKTITFALVIADISGMPLQRGYSGFGGIPGYIMTVYSEPNEYNLARIKGATVHELHHNLLGAAFPEQPMIANLGAYIVGEGLAESFAAELYGEDIIGFYVTDFDKGQFERAKELIQGALEVSDFNELRQYIFGDTIMGTSAGVPDFAGYALGYQLVQAYLERTGKSVVEATFDGYEEIIAQSGFFN